MDIPKQIELNSDKIRLVPLTTEHLAGFYRAAKSDELWRWTAPHQCRDLASASRWLRLALDKVAQGQQVAFAIIDVATEQIVGSTRYCSIDIENRGIEIGFTFVSPQFQRSYVNSHAKLLLLRYAFEQLGAIRVQFRTHQHNQKSRNAIARLGATFEGIIRHQRILETGDIRDTAQFSITDVDWPTLKPRLTAMCDDKGIRGNHERSKSDIVPLPESYRQLIASNPLAQLMIATHDNLGDQIIHLPLVYDPVTGKLQGHISSANKLNWLLAREPNIIVVFQGDDCYISPSIHSDIVVPTWNYQVLHLSATFEFVADNDRQKKLELLQGQIEQFETSNWRLDSQPQVTIDAMLPHIRCFEIAINKASHRYKISQNKSREIVEAIAQHLGSMGQAAFADNHLNHRH